MVPSPVFENSALNVSTLEQNKTYDEIVKAQLEAEYSLINLEFVELGEHQLSHWVFPQNETVSHMPFSQSLRCMLKKPPDSPYACSLRVPIVEPLKEGEGFLLTLWMRCRSEGAGKVAHGVELGTDPYTNLLWYECSPCEGWRQWWFPFTSPEDFEAGTTRYQLLFQEKAQDIEIAGLRLLRLSPTRTGGLPNSRVYPSQSPEQVQQDSKPDDFFQHVVDSVPLNPEDSLLPQQQWQLLKLAQGTPNLSLDWSHPEDRLYRDSLTCHTAPQALEERRVVSFPLARGFQEDDELLLRVDIRNAVPAAGVVNHLVQLPLTDSPLLSVHQPLKSEWQTLTMRFKASGSALPGEAVYRLVILGNSPSTEIGGIVLLNLGVAGNEKPKTRLKAVPVERQDGISEKIDSARRSGLKIRVEDRFGEPIPSCELQIRQLKHGFGLGTSVQEDLICFEGGNEYSRRLTDLTGRGQGFNRVFPEWHLNWMCWDEWNKPLGKARDIQLLRWLSRQGFDIRGHYLVSGNAYHLPTFVQFFIRNRARVLDAIKRRIESALTFDVFRRHIREWDLLNEPFMVFDLWNLLGQSGVSEMFRQAASLQPDTRFFINQNQLLSVGGLDIATVKKTRRLMECLRDQTSAKLGLGLQGHFRGFLPSTDQLQELLERLGDDGWDL